jgi:hypothetical protein
MLQLFDRLSPAQLERLLNVQDLSEEQDAHARLYCAACGALITDEEQRIEVQGQHQHHCQNPQGLQFTIGCFRDVSGCVCVGAETAAWSWFKGFCWTVALCTSCRTHLGWRYRAQVGEVFFGLILDRLVSEAHSGP